jgi:hypothetical protein
VSNYLLVHHFPENFQGSPETAAAARAWFASLGSNLTGSGNPSFETRQLGNCATGSARMAAYTLISTDNLDQAVALAEAWPLLTRGGGVEVRELPSPNVGSSSLMPRNTSSNG